MSKKLILFLMVLLFGSTSFLRADELTVHDGTGTSSYVPVYGFYADAYLKCEMVFPAAELAVMENATINGMTFYASEASVSWGAANFQVFVSEVESATISDFAGPGTVVYEGGLSVADNVMTVTFDTPYEYHGGNLLVGFYNTVTGTYVSCSWNGETVDGSCVQGYSYSALSAVTATQRNFLPKTTFVFESGTVPPVPPTGGVSITPNPFVLGERPTNGWMEPYAVRIENGGAPVSITANISNTAGVEAFSMSEEINNVVLDTDETLAFTIDINTNAPAGEYTEQFTLFSVENSRDITTVPVTATFYEAGEADIVETAKTIALSYTSGVANFSETPANLHANYFGYNQNTALDAVYEFSLVKDAKISVEGGVFIGIYNKVLDFHPTAAIMPVAMTYDGTLTDEILLAGDYYMIVAGDNITTVEGTVEQMPAPTALTAIAPTDGATEVAAPVTLTWEGGDNAAEYQVLFGTSPTNIPVVLDWTIVDDNYGSYTVEEIANNTQYFWQINVKNSNGTVTGPRWGFTSSLIAPNGVTADPTEIFTDETTLIKWRLAGAGGFTGSITVCDGTATSSYVPVYGIWMDTYTRSEMIYPAEMLEEMGGGEITSIKYYISSPSSGSWAPASFNVYMMEVDATTLSSYYGSANATVVYSGSLDGTGTEMVINFDTPYLYNGGNLLVGIEEPTVGTYHSCYFYGVAATGASGSGYSSSSLSAVTFNQQNFLPKTTFVCGDERDNRGLLGFNVYYGTTKANTELITETRYTLGNLPYNMEGHDINVTAVYQEGESGHSTPVVEVQVSGYSTFTGVVTELISGDPVAGATVTFTGKDEFNNTVEFAGQTNNSGVYTVTAKAGNYRGVATLEGMEPANSAAVTLAYGATTTVDFVIHELYKPVLGVLAEELDHQTAKVTWSINTAIGGGGGGTGGGATTFTEDFEGGLNNWSVIKVNTDGGEWIHSDANLGGYDYTTLAHGGTGFAMCYSYVDYVGPYNTDSYLVTPEKYSIVAGSTLSFWADNANDSYPENFSVCVATTDNPTAADFTQVWSGGAKEMSNNNKAAVRHNDTRYNNWRLHTIDLSAYAGQNVWIAFHDVNYDMYEIWIDDVELSESGKGRSFDYYAVYRKAILKENALTPADSVFITNTTDTLYADFTWNNMEPGLYQYGVSAVYPIPGRGNRDDAELTVYEGTTENYYVPMFTMYFDEWTRTQYVIPAGDLTDMAGSQINAIKYTTSSYNMPYTTASAVDIYMTEVNYTSIDDYVDKAATQVVYSGTIDFVSTADGGEAVITFDAPYTYNGGNLLIGCENTTNAGWKRIDFKGQTVEGASVSNSNSYSTAGVSAFQRNFIPQTTFFYAGGGSGSNENPITPITWSNVLPKDMDATVTVKATASTGSVEGAVVTFTNLNENVEYIEEIDETGTLTIEDFRKGEYTLTVELDGYISNYNETAVSIWEDMEFNAYFTENFLPVDAFAVSGTGFARWTDMLPEEAKVAERYQVMLNNIYQGETTNNYMQLNVEGLTVGQTYTAKVAVVYTTGMSAWTEATFTYVDCSTVSQQVEDLAGISNCMDVVLTWNGGTPGPGPTPPTPPTPPTGDATVVLSVPTDIWGDGTGYQMLLDADATMYTQLASVDYFDDLGSFAGFEYFIPENADYGVNATNVVVNNTVSIQIPAGTYDYAIINPDNYSTIWFASSNGNVSSKGDDMVFEGGKTYTFNVYGSGTGDAVDLTVTDSGKNVQFVYNKPNINTVSRVNPNVKFYGVAATNNREELTYNFDDNTMAGWTSIDADGDGNGWVSSANPGIYHNSGVNLSGTGHNASEAYVISGSYANGTGAVLYPNNYLVSPNKAVYSQISFWACAQDASYAAEHFGVAVSTTGNTSGADFTTIQEWTMTAKGQGAASVGRDGQTRVQGSWYEYTVDLSAYAGQEIWVAIRHFNCSDMFILNVDDITLTTGAGGGGGGATSAVTPNKYNIFMDGVIVGATSDSNFTVTVEDTNTHTYEVFFVDANYNFSCPASVEVAAGTIASVTDLAGVQQWPNYIITWNGIADTYVIYRGVVDMSTGMVDLNVIGETTETTFTDVIPNVAGNYIYVVQTVKGECSSDLQEEIDNENYLMIVFTMVDENSIVKAIYPNPTSGDLHINATAMKHISIINAMGQVVYNQDVNNDETVINMAKFESGVYMVNIITENGSSVKRVTVTK